MTPQPKLFSWKTIDRIFLDLDGTLLDKYFDDYFWEEYVPGKYAKKYATDEDTCRKKLIAIYKTVENTLEWTNLDYWSERLGLDIPALKKEINHLVRLHPYVTDFLAYVREKGKEIFLVTNAHPKSLEVKLAKEDITGAFDGIIHSQAVGFAKEQPEFWPELAKIQPFDKRRTLFVDDTVRVLDTARQYGFTHLIHIAKPSSKLPYAPAPGYLCIRDFQQLLF